MTNYTLLYSKPAEKYLKRINRTKAISILKRMEYVGINPFKTDNNIAKLSNTISSYRLRIGDMRVVYEVDVKKRIIYITKIAPRGSVYN